jgi:hypothetical protein
MSLAEQGADSRFRITAPGRVRHANEILKVKKVA